MAGRIKNAYHSLPPVTTLKTGNMIQTVQITESRLQSDAYKWFHNTYPEQRGQLFMIYNNPKNAAHGSTLKAMGMVAGCSDLVYLAPAAKVYFLECKLPGGVQSKDQKKFESMVKKIGHEYKIFRSEDEFKNIIQKINTCQK